MADFRYALGGKLYRGSVDMVAATEAVVDLPGGGDTIVVGLPIVPSLDTVTIATAADNEDYSVTINGRTFTIDSGGSATTTTIRNALKAAVDAVAASLGIVTANVSTNAFSIQALVPGSTIVVWVLAETPANMTLAKSLVTTAGNVGIVSKNGNTIVIRSSAAMTAEIPLVVVG